MADMTALQRDILFAVAGLESPNGQEIRRELAETQGRDVLSGHIYLSIEQLVDAGLVAKQSRDGRSNEYSLTETGETWLDNRLAWEREYVSFDSVFEQSGDVHPSGDV